MHGCLCAFHQTTPLTHLKHSILCCVSSVWPQLSLRNANKKSQQHPQKSGVFKYSLSQREHSQNMPRKHVGRDTASDLGALAGLAFSELIRNIFLFTSKNFIPRHNEDL